MRVDTTPGLIPDFVPSDQISICQEKKGKDGDPLPLCRKRAGLKSEAQTKFNLPWAVDLRGHTERRTPEGTPLVQILEIHVGVVEPWMIENVAERGMNLALNRAPTRSPSLTQTNLYELDIRFIRI